MAYDYDHVEKNCSLYETIVEKVYDQNSTTAVVKCEGTVFNNDNI